MRDLCQQDRAGSLVKSPPSVQDVQESAQIDPLQAEASLADAAARTQPALNINYVSTTQVSGSIGVLEVPQPQPTARNLEAAQGQNADGETLHRVPQSNWSVESRMMNWSHGVSLDLSMTPCSVPQTPLSPSIYGFPQVPCSPRAPTPTQKLSTSAKQWLGEGKSLNPTPDLFAGTSGATTQDNLDASSFPQPVARPGMEEKEHMTASERERERIRERRMEKR